MAKQGQTDSINFEFLRLHDSRLSVLAAQAEQYFPEDPVTAIFKLRQLAEQLAKLVAAHHSLYLGERETFEETLRRLSYDRIVPREAADIFHALRKVGNTAVHEDSGDHATALTALKIARQLGIWFHRTYGKQPKFAPGPFVPPKQPLDATAALQQEIADLRSKATQSASLMNKLNFVRRLSNGSSAGARMSPLHSSKPSDTPSRYGSTKRAPSLVDLGKTLT